MQQKKCLVRFSLLLSLVALLLSLTFNVILFLQARAYYLELNASHLDPFGISAFSTDLQPNTIPVTSTITVVFLGDSRAERWLIPPKIKGFSFINRGINNQTSVQVLGRFYKHVLPLHPKIIIVQVGINDLKTIPLFPDRQTTIIANCKANIQEIVKRSRSLGATVILTTIIPAGEIPLVRKPFWSSDIDRAVVEVNSYISSLQAPNVIILDSYSLLNQKQKNNYYRDSLHLNDRGYEILNKELTKVLIKL